MDEWVWVPVIVIGFLLISLYLGIRGGSGSAGTTADHVVAGRKLGLLLLFFVAVGEIYSSASFLGGPGWAYEHGVPILYSPMTGILAVLVMYWLGPRIQLAGKRLNLLTQAHYLSVSKLVTGVWGLFACYIATQAANIGALIEVVNQIGSFFYGSILGVFVLAIATRANSIGALVGLVAGMATVAFVGFTTDVAWLWQNVIGTATVTIVGVVVTMVTGGPVVQPRT